MTLLSDEENKKESFRIVFGRANSLLASGEIEESIIYYQRAVELQPRSAEAWIIYGEILFDLARYEEALFAFDKAIEAHRKCSYSWLNRGLTLINLGRLEESISSWENVVIFASTAIEQYTREGHIHLSSERPEMAINCYDI